MRSLKNHTNEALVALLNKGNEKAFMEIYDRHKNQLASNLVRLLNSRELAEDVLQEVFMILWERRREIDASRSVSAYLHRSAVNKTKNIFRKVANDKRLRNEFSQQFKAAQNNIVETWIEDKEIKQFLHTLLDRLPAQQKKVYMLCKLEGLSYKEVSYKLKISVTTVNSHIRNANIFLKKELQNQTDLSSFFYIALAVFLL